MAKPGNLPKNSAFSEFLETLDRKEISRSLEVSVRLKFLRVANSMKEFRGFT